MSAAPQLTSDEIDDILYCARAGEVDELTEVMDTLVARLGGSAREDLSAIVAAATNEAENTALHYAAANGHKDVLAYLLPRLSLPTLLQPNAAGNTSLHWAALNGHLTSVQLLTSRIEELSPLPSEDSEPSTATEGGEEDKEPTRCAWDVRNKAGRGPMSEAQMNGKEDVVRWLLERMVGGPPPSATREEVGEEDTPSKKEEEEEGEIRIVKGAEGEKEVEKVREGVERVSVGDEVGK